MTDLSRSTLLLRRAGSTAALLLGALVAAPAATAGAQQPSVDAVLDRALAAWGKVRTLRGSFEQTISNPLTGGLMESQGQVEQQRSPSRISIRFSDPSGDRIVADGRVLWLYLPSTTPGQVLKQPLGASGAGNVDVTAQFFTSPRTRYNISAAGAATVGGRATRALLLVPKTPGSVPFTKATVWVDDRDGLVRQFEVTDANGLTRRVRMTSLSINVPVKPSTFTFTPPPGTRVVDQTR